MNKLTRCISIIIVVVAFILPGVFAANQAPLIDAGEDQYGTTSESMYLRGSAEDDNTEIDSLKIVWTQIAGPVQAQILAPASTFSLVQFSKPGIYHFVLTVTDKNGMYSSDTTRMEIIKDEFVLLFPTENQPIKIGSTVTIRWRMLPSQPCRVSLSLDNEKSWQIISISGAISDSLKWTVDSDLKSGAGKIKVEQYDNHSRYITGTIILTDSATAIKFAGSPKSVKAVPGVHAPRVLANGRIVQKSFFQKSRMQLTFPVSTRE